MIRRFIDSSVIGPSLRLTLTASEDTRHAYGKINIRGLVERIGEVAEAEFIECAVSLFEHSVVGVIAVVQPRAPALDTSLRASGALRAELANATTSETPPLTQVQGYVSREQGQGDLANCLPMARLPTILFESKPAHGKPKKNIRSQLKLLKLVN